MESVHEEWRSVQGSGGTYEVSSLGRIRSLTRMVVDTTGRRQVKRGTVLKPRCHSGGYRVVNVLDDGKFKTKFVHSIVADAFIGSRPEGHDVNHIDGDKSNNAASNMEYATRKENMDHAWNLGLVDNRGECNGQARYTEDQIRKCFELVRSGKTQREASELSGVSVGMVQQVWTGNRWKHLNLKPAG